MHSKYLLNIGERDVKEQINYIRKYGIYIHLATLFPKVHWKHCSTKDYLKLFY